MIVTLTDFGRSEYLGVMKGVINEISPDSKIIDLCNEIESHNVREAAWILFKNYEYFSEGTIFLCVVDPGVGGKRNALAVKTKNYFFVGPDNGLMYPALKEDGVEKVIGLSTEGASQTFHGRDVFAKAAAKLDKGIKIGELGEETQLEKKLRFYLKGRTGEIVRIDHFGNIITNLEPLDKRVYSVKYGGEKKGLNLYRTYESAPENELFLIVGSADTLEVSMKNRKAIKRFEVKVGDRIEIK